MESHPTNSRRASDTLIREVQDVEVIISVDLEEAARRSETFPKEWSEQKLRGALRSYERFLLLAAKHPDVAIAPTREIDEMWHLHMLHPRAYYEDCMRVIGRILDHDGGFGQEPEEVPVLAATFERTAKLWEEAYGEPYVSRQSADAGESTVKCWHDCQGRCWHACKEATPHVDAVASQ
ncbi:MAG: glycine-rich domain-containing protein-like [Deltaproteobacteria bacterium]|jgi:hypothetical protein